jgi:hypothetical protein
MDYDGFDVHDPHVIFLTDIFAYLRVQAVSRSLFPFPRLFVSDNNNTIKNSYSLYFSISYSPAFYTGTLSAILRPEPAGMAYS